MLDEVIDAHMLVLHVRFGTDIGAAPGTEHRQEARANVRGRDQAQRPRTQVEFCGCGGDASAAGAVADGREVVARRLAAHRRASAAAATRRGLRLDASAHDSHSSVFVFSGGETAVAGVGEAVAADAAVSSDGGRPEKLVAMGRRRRGGGGEAFEFREEGGGTRRRSAPPSRRGRLRSCIVFFG